MNDVFVKFLLLFGDRNIKYLAKEWHKDGPKENTVRE